MTGHRLDPSAAGARPPSGRQHRLAVGDQEAVITESGATLRLYRRAGRPVVDGFAEDHRSEAGAGQILMPWPNRIRDGRYSFGGSSHQLALNEPARGNAIHGLARWLSWRTDSASEDAVRLSCRLMAQDGYPFGLQLGVEYRLGEAGMTVTMTALNEGATPAPFGAGAHPYLIPPGGSVDRARLTVPADTVLVTDERGIPVGSAPVEGTGFDFRSPRPIGSLAMDTAFTRLSRDEQGRATVRLGDDQGTTELWADGGFDYLMVFTADTLAGERRRRAVAVEPMTCPPNAFATGEALVVLQPGEAFAGSWGITPFL